MTKLHEVLAAEKTVSAAWSTLYEETLKKLGNNHFFEGHTKSLKMLEDSPGNEAIEAQAAEHKALPTNVHDTLEYTLGILARHEDLQLQKNLTNTMAKADVEFRGQTIFTGLPVDQLLGLEARLTKVSTLFVTMPTLDASKNWTYDSQLGCWVAPPEHTVKTEKIMVPVVMSPATDKHPAQVKESTKDNTVGKFTSIKRSGAVTAVQKAEAIKLIDELMVEVKKARMRANETVVVDAKLGKDLLALLMAPLKN